MLLGSFCILWLVACVDYSSAGATVNVSSRVGATALLPCKITNTSSQPPRVRWSTYYGVVFERNGTVTTEGLGYEGRVDVPEGELRKGDCSLVLKNIRLTDDSFNYPYMVEYAYSANKWNKVDNVSLFVDVIQNISAQVGSTVLLPCSWRNQSTETPHVEWSTDREILFERLYKDVTRSQNYEGRVDVPLEELLKGNCSLVLKNVTVSDSAIYKSGLAVKHTAKTILAQKVKLTVTTEALGEAALHAPGLLILGSSILMSLLFSH